MTMGGYFLFCIVTITNNNTNKNMVYSVTIGITSSPHYTCFECDGITARIKYSHTVTVFNLPIPLGTINYINYFNKNLQINFPNSYNF